MKCAMNKIVATACLLLSMTAYAGYNQGVGSYEKNDCATDLKEFESLARQGSASAQFYLGQIYTSSCGVPQDYKEAVKWFRLAADQGFALAQFSLGVMYATGQGVPQDSKEAVRWFRLAADQANADGQNNLGVSYVSGRGVIQSRVIGFALFSMSASNNPSAINLAAADRKGAATNRENLSLSMTAAEIAKGQSLLREMSKPGMLLKVLDR